jgi:hypothetical protein
VRLPAELVRAGAVLRADEARVVRAEIAGNQTSHPGDDVSALDDDLPFGVTGGLPGDVESIGRGQFAAAHERRHISEHACKFDRSEALTAVIQQFAEQAAFVVHVVVAGFTRIGLNERRAAGVRELHFGSCGG